jgi:hypothetical protein
MLVPMVNVQGASAKLDCGMEVGVASCVGDIGCPATAMSDGSDPMVQCAVETITKLQNAWTP